MCGVVAMVGERNVVPVLLEGLQRLEYRGYDSAGLVVLDENQKLQRERTTNRVANLKQQSQKLNGKIGLAHTRWATHGIPATKNAHPHIADDRIALVHNGILENYMELKEYCLKQGSVFHSDTDSEVIVQLLALTMKQQSVDLKTALKLTKQKMKGAYTIVVMDKKNPDQLIGFRCGTPLIVSIGFSEYFLSSDTLAVSFASREYTFLEEGDLAVLSNQGIVIENGRGKVVYHSDQPASANKRKFKGSIDDGQLYGKGEYRHFMHKEIHEQPEVVADTLQNCISGDRLLVECFGQKAPRLLEGIERIQVIACGTSYHAGMVFRYWCEDIIQLPVNVEVASEFRYRNPVMEKNVLFVVISQSGETADTIAATKNIAKQNKKDKNNHSLILVICNRAESTLSELSDLLFLTKAGLEIGVASTKAFTTQLVALSLLLVAVGKVQNRLSEKNEKNIINGLKKTPKLLKKALQQEESIIELSQILATSSSAIFLGRGTMYPIALEGALKLKEISYIHAEAFPSGELKHGPLALVDENMPVIVIAPNNDLLSKLNSNLEEIVARGGKIYAFEDKHSKLKRHKGIHVITVAENIGRISSAIIFNVPLQLLAYHVALFLGTDIDQPRNLAKSVTVE